MRGSVTVCSVSLTTMPRWQCRPADSASCGVGADAGGHHHQVGGDLAAVLEAHGHHAGPRPSPDQACVCAPMRNAQAARFERLRLQQVAGHSSSWRSISQSA
jgi:hypothetical protein